jgi:universal stress protein A
MAAPLPDPLPYRRILAAVDLGPDSQRVGRQARALAAAAGAEVALLHVVEYVPTETLGETLLPAVEIEADLVRRATTRLAALARELGLAADVARVASGSTKAEIVRLAAQMGADLVVIGAHERHGLSILVNLTADTVLHAVHCDLLAVRLR